MPKNHVNKKFIYTVCHKEAVIKDKSAYRRDSKVLWPRRLLGTGNEN
jgi:hypothetical protein